MEDIDDEYKELFKGLRTPEKEHVARKLRRDLDEAPGLVLIPRSGTSFLAHRPRPFMLRITDLGSASRLQVASLGHPVTVAGWNQGANTAASELACAGGAKVTREHFGCGYLNRLQI